MVIVVGSLTLPHSNWNSIAFYRKDYVYSDPKLEYSVLTLPEKENCS